MSERLAILVNESGGYYKPNPNADPESWAEVLAEADHAELLEPLTGWGEWAEAWRVWVGRDVVTYFVTPTSRWRELLAREIFPS